MKRIAIFRVAVVLCLVCLTASPLFAGEVNLSVAASLKETINELTDNFAKRNPGVKFLKNYGASGSLAKQVENGAPADVFISANVEWMDYLKNKKIADAATVKTFTFNTLVFAGPEDKKISG